MVSRIHRKALAMSTSAQQPHILVIDGSENVREILCIVLEDEGYRVSVAPFPPDADVLLRLAPDVIMQELLFHGRPEAGWASLASARLHPVLACIPRVLCTTARETVAEPAMAANLERMGVRVVIKPFEDLLAAVAESLSARNLAGQVRLVQDDTSGGRTPSSLGVLSPESMRSS
jgi:CheY-like chemotaxis protein